MMSFIFTCEYVHGAAPYQRAKNSIEDHLAALVTTILSGRGSRHVELQPRAPCGHG